jgi:hypothetical protein
MFTVSAPNESGLTSIVTVLLPSDSIPTVSRSWATTIPEKTSTDNAANRSETEVICPSPN